MMNVVEFQDVHRGYKRGADVLKGVSFSVPAGQVVGLLGKNGAGKTTLLRIAMGLLQVGRGSARIFGQDPRRDCVPIRRRIGYVAEDQSLPPFLSVDDVIDLHRGLYPSWDDELAGQLARRFELPGRARIRKLSKGQARQVALLCAVSHRPELLILDEPAGGLDPAARREFLETSIQLLNEAGSTILFSSHHMNDVERMASRLVMIHEGILWIDSDLEEIREGFCLALVPCNRVASRQELLRIDGCLCAREHADAVHAVFELDPPGCRASLQRELGIADARCTPLALEEMFIELVGGRSCMPRRCRAQAASTWSCPCLRASCGCHTCRPC